MRQRLLLAAGLLALSLPVGGVAPLMGGAKCAAAGSSVAPPTSDELASQMRQSLGVKDPAAQLRLIRGLRTLKDPALAPLFTQMGTAKSSALRAESTLALAELAPARGLDLLPVRKLEPAMQAFVLSEALELGLVKTEQLEDLAGWGDLQPGLYVSIAARLVAAQKRVDPARLREALKGEDVAVASVAGVLLTQLGQGDGVAPVHEKLIKQQGKAGGTEAIRRVLAIIRDRRLASGGDLARKVFDASAKDRLLRFEAAATIIAVDPSGERAAGLLAAELAACVDSAEKVRLATAAAYAALERDAGLPAKAIDAMKRDGEPIVSLLGQSLEAMAKKSAAAPAMEKLIERRSIPGWSWALKAAARLSADDARAVRLAMVNSALSTNERAFEELAGQAATALAQTDPEVLRGPLLAAVNARDDRTAIVILQGAIRSDNPKAALLGEVGRGTMETDREAPAWPSPAVEATAVLARGRFAEKPSQALIESLARVATGSGKLPETLRVQAAWLALKGSTDDRAALTRLLADVLP